MANAKFTARLAEAIGILVDSKSMKARAPKSGSLFSPVYRKGKYEWVKVLDSDGVLLSERTVHTGKCAKVDQEAKLLVGVIVQSEDARLRPKPIHLEKHPYLTFRTGYGSVLERRVVVSTGLLLSSYFRKGQQRQTSPSSASPERM